MDKYLLGKWTVDPIACILTSDNESRQIEPKCMELLVLLIKANGEVVSRSEIMDSIWQGRFVTEHVLNNLVASLRKYLRSEEGDSYIKTRPKRGYQLTLPATVIPQATINAATSSAINQQDASVVTPKAHKNKVLKIPFFRWFGIFTTAVFFAMIGSFVWYQSKKDDAVPLSVAVVPFEVYDSRSDLTHFAQGLVEETIHQLSAKSDLIISSHALSFAQYQEKATSNSAQLKPRANYLLEGSVRPEHDLLRITVRLVNSENGNLLWSRVFTANLEQVIAAQNRIGGELTQTVSESLANPASLAQLERESVPHEAFLHLLRGRKLNSQGAMESYVKALDEFKMATLIAPNYLEAHLDLALNYLILAQQKRMNTKDANRLALLSIDKALEIAPEHAKSYSLKATYHQNMAEFALAEQSYQKALAIDPDLYIAQINYANMMRLQRRYNESLVLYRKAHHIAPRSSAANWAIGSILISLGRFDEAESQYRQCMDMLPDYDACIAGLAYVQRLTTNNSSADEALEKYIAKVTQSHYWFENIVAWHQFWRNETSPAAHAYLSLVDKYGYSMESVDTASLSMWQTDDLTVWGEKLTQANSKQKTTKTTAALAYTYYLAKQCDSHINYAEQLLDKAPYYFDGVETMANLFSYRAALAYCYLQNGNRDNFEKQLTALEQDITALPESAHQAAGVEFVKGHYFILKGDYKKAEPIATRLKQRSATIKWMLLHDPIYRKLSTNNETLNSI